MVGLAREYTTMAQQFEYPVDEWFTGEYENIPVDMQDGIKRYVIEKLRPGNFLSAIITNDLRGAVGHADAVNLPLISLYVRWFYNRAPAACHGSNRQMEEWLARKESEASVS